MKPLSSLKNRVFMASALVAVLSIALGTQLVTMRVSREAEAELRRGLDEAAELLSEHYVSRYETLATMAWLIADLPKLKAAVATGDGPTVAPLARDYRLRLGSDIIGITDAAGTMLAIGGLEEGSALAEGVLRARGGSESTYFRETSEGVLEIVTLPISIGPDPPEVLGTLSVGFFLNEALARELAAIAGSEVVLVVQDRVVAGTLPVTEDQLEGLFPNDEARVAIGGKEYVGLSRYLAGDDGPAAVVLRSRSERLSFLRTFREGLLLSALFGVLMATVISYAVARTVTRPLAAVTGAMREMSSTGDWTRKLELRGRWIDEDAALLTSAFNRLTSSIERFQREAASKERLSALGRMSAVIAHEIRNPLMIIKASLRGLRREKLQVSEVREAAEDIDHEVARLNRMVGDVLDFARPVALDLHPTDLNALCRHAAESVLIENEEPSPRLEMCLADELPEVVTDRERLLLALVNVLSNARDAVEERKERAEISADGPDIELETMLADGDRVSIVVRDRGIGIEDDQILKIFEPYFTGKRTGTGLGLAITKNIVESLGGTVTAQSRPAEGTEIRIDLFRATAEPLRGVT